MRWWRKPTQAELDEECEKQRVADEETRLADEAELAAEKAEEEATTATARMCIRELFTKNSANGERFVDIPDSDDIPGSLEKLPGLILELANEKKDEVETVHFYSMSEYGPRGALLTMRRAH